MPIHWIIPFPLPAAEAVESAFFRSGKPSWDCQQKATPTTSITKSSSFSISLVWTDEMIFEIRVVLYGRFLNRWTSPLLQIYFGKRICACFLKITRAAEPPVG